MEITINLSDEQANAVIIKQGGLEYLQTYCEQFANTMISQVNDDLRSGLINSVRAGLDNDEMRFLASMPIEELKAIIAKMKAEKES